MKLSVKYLENYLSDWPRIGLAKAGDSGFDLRAAVADDIVLTPSERQTVPNGIQVQMHAETTDFEIQVRPRSGWAAKFGLTVVNTPGTIDWGYRGELMTILLNTGKEDIIIHPGDRIAQMVVCPIIRPIIEEVQQLDETERGATGFASSGTQ